MRAGSAANCSASQTRWLHAAAGFTSERTPLSRRAGANATQVLDSQPRLMLRRNASAKKARSSAAEAGVSARCIATRRCGRRRHCRHTTFSLPRRNAHLPQLRTDEAEASAPDRFVCDEGVTQLGEFLCGHPRAAQIGTACAAPSAPSSLAMPARPPGQSALARAG